jgi:hypothetical protein
VPSRPLLCEPPVDAGNVYEALSRAALLDPREAGASIWVVLPRREWMASPEPVRSELVADVRDWIAGVHAGETRQGFFSIERDTLPLLDGELHP